MECTHLGSTSLTVSRIVLGCMTYGTSEWRPWVLDEDDARPFYRRAIEAGINFFDTANMYSLGVSEEVTGQALREYGVREELVIATKVFFPMADGPNRGGLSRTHIGATKLEHLDAAIRAVDLRLDPEEVEGLESPYRPHEIWVTDSALIRP